MATIYQETSFSFITLISSLIAIQGM